MVLGRRPQRTEVRSAAAAGDPVATAQPRHSSPDPQPLPTPRPRSRSSPPGGDQLIDGSVSRPMPTIAGSARPRSRAWRTALRHLDAGERIDGDAALRGPLAEERGWSSRMPHPDLPPISWASFCDRAAIRLFPRTNSARSVGSALLNRSSTPHRWPAGASLLRVPRGRWQQATDLGEFVEHYDVRQGPRKISPSGGRQPSARQARTAGRSRRRSHRAAPTPPSTNPIAGGRCWPYSPTGSFREPRPGGQLTGNGTPGTGCALGSMTWNQFLNSPSRHRRPNLRYSRATACTRSTMPTLRPSSTAR